MLACCVLFSATAGASASDEDGLDAYSISEACLWVGDDVVAEGTFHDMWADAVGRGNGIVQLLSDVTGGFGDGDGFFRNGLSVPAGMRLGLDLNGFTLDRNLVDGSASERVISLFDETSVLDIYDTAGGGIITGCDTEGAALYVAGTLNLKGGSIRSNSVGHSTVHVAKTGRFVMDTVTDDGAHIGAVVINEAKPGAKCGGIYVEGSLVLGGDVRVQNNGTNVLVACDSYDEAGHVYMSRPINDGYSVYMGSETGSAALVTGTDAYSVTAGDAGSFESDDSERSFDYMSGYLVWHRTNATPEASIMMDDGGTLTGSFAGMWNVAASLGRGEVTLLSNVTAYKTYDTDLCTSFGSGIGFDGYGRLAVNAGVDVVLNLNNKILDKGMSGKSSGDVSGTIFMVRRDGILTIRDASNSGIIRGAYGRETGAIYVCEGGTLRFEGGILSNNSSTSGAGGMRVDGTAYVSGGRIVNNDVGVIVTDVGKLVLSDEARIYSNTHDGKADNLKIMDGARVSVVAPLSSVANVHVNMGNEGMTVVASRDGSSTQALSDSDAAAFTVDNSRKVVRVDGENLVIGDQATGTQASYTNTAGSLVSTGTFVDCMNQAATNGGTVRLLEDVDVAVDSWFQIRNTDVTIALNGHHLHLDKSQYEIFNVIHGGSLTIRDNGAPVSSRTVVESVGTDADNLVATFKSWQSNTATWDDVSSTLTYYAIEENDGFYELARYVDDYSSVGRVHMESPKDSVACITANKGNVVIRGGLFTGTLSSAKLCSVTEGNVTVNGGTFALFENGVLDVSSGKFDVRDGHFIGNTGGSVVLSGSSAGTVYGGRFLDNSAVDGAAIKATGGSNLHVGSNVIFSLNKASSNGGAIYHTGTGKLSLVGTRFKGSEGERSGAVYSDGDAEVKDCAFIGCYAMDGSSSYGGGLRMKSGTVSGTTFVQCEAHTGGGLSSCGDATIRDSSFEGCSAYDLGGGIYARNGTLDAGGTFVHACKANHGAGIALASGSEAQLEGEVADCVATGTGGGLLIQDGVKGVTVRMDIKGNKAARGGGMAVENDVANDIVSESTIDGNTGTEYGGGLLAHGHGSGNLRIIDSRVTNNKAEGSVNDTLTLLSRGGGILIKGCNLAVQGGSVDGNSGWVGGGIFVTSGRSAFMGTSISDNVARHGGGGLAVREATIDLMTCSVQANRVDSVESLSGDTGGGGIMIRVGGTVNATGCTISNNVSPAGGGGVQVENGVFRSNSSFIQRNVAKQGGGVNLATLTASVGSFIDTTITGNTASDRGGGIIGAEGTTLNIGGKVICTDNKSARDFDNVNLRGSGVCNITAALTNGSDIGITTTNVPTMFAPVIFAQGIDAEDAVKYFSHDNVEWKKEYDPETGYCIFVNDSVQGSIVDEDNANIDGVLVQYYANQRIPSEYASGFKFDILNTRGKVMPSNSVMKRDSAGNPVGSYATMNLFVDDATGEVKMRDVLSKIFKSREFDYDEHLQVDTLNRFMKEDGWMWVAHEIWILKDGKSQNSTDKSDWDVVTWSPSKNLGELGIEKGDCIRIVSDSVQDDLNIDTTFYDYDISNGYWYATSADAQNDRNRKEISTYTVGKTAYFRTYESGINSSDNYEGDGARLSFGNDNAGAKWGLATVSENGTDYPMNSANRGVYRLCHFGLVKGVDDAGNLVWNDAVSAPKLFNDGEAIGKEVISEKSLKFTRRGDTYTLTAVNGVGDVAQNLDKLVHPVYGTTTYKNLITNHFWPLDEVGTAGTDGHDMKTGLLKDSTKWYYGKKGGGAVTSMGTGALPVSDNGVAHDNYFGMHFSVKFSTESDYVAPLGYYFYGDDDLFVFLDGQLIIDIGGVHQSAGCYTDLRDYIPEGDSAEHVLSFYYLERGASGSTCWMQFNLPHNVRAAVDDTFMFIKTNQDGEPLGDAVFGIYRDQACTDLLQSVISDAEGKIRVTDLETTRVYYLKEMSAPEDYIIDGNTYVMSFGSEEWSMYELGDDDKVHKDSLANTYKEKPFGEMPETGGSGRYWIYGLGIGLLSAGGLMILAMKKRKK